MAKMRPSLSSYACLDMDRESRTGEPEMVLAEGKKWVHLVDIVKKLLQTKGRAIVTRISNDEIARLKVPGYKREPHPEAGILILKRKGYKAEKQGGVVGVLTAGTSDFRVGEEAKVVAEELGCKVITFHDVGVAGVHRTFDALEAMDPHKVDVFIVIAGREGALPTLVAGLVNAPVIGVPVSTGYGKGGKGEAALMAMLQSCSPIVVVNIDAGFVAGVVASRIARRMAVARGRASQGRSNIKRSGRKKIGKKGKKKKK